MIFVLSVAAFFDLSQHRGRFRSFSRSLSFVGAAVKAVASSSVPFLYYHHDVSAVRLRIIRMKDWQSFHSKVPFPPMQFGYLGKNTVKRRKHGFCACSPCSSDGMAGQSSGRRACSLSAPYQVRIISLPSPCHLRIYKQGLGRDLIGSR